MQRLFKTHKALIGMVHTRALPGAPASALSVSEIADHAAREAALLAECGFDGLIFENMHDRPYVMPVGHEIVAAMTTVGCAVRAAAPSLAIGVQLLSGSGAATIAVAHAVGAQFVRVENFTMAHVADEGLMPTAEAGPLLRYRKMIGAANIAIFADVKKKHASHAITADQSLTDAIAAAEFFSADAVILSGRATGDPTPIDELAQARAATKLPLFVGSGATPDQTPQLLRHADGVIVGSALKTGGVWSNDLDRERCLRMVDAFRSA